MRDLDERVSESEGILTGLKGDGLVIPKSKDATWYGECRGRDTLASFSFCLHLTSAFFCTDKVSCPPSCPS